MANKHLQHVKSNVVNNGSPKLPTIDQILLGEIGINYADGYERMSIKNDHNEIVEFVSKEYVDTSLSTKANSNDVYTKTETNNIIFGQNTVPSGEGEATNVQELINKTVYGTTTPSPTQTSASVVTTENLSTTLSGYATTNAIADFFDGAEYTNGTGEFSGKKVIAFKHGSTVKVQVDATDFIKDGMLSNAEIKNVTISGQSVKCLVLTFNTDADKNDINIPISQIFDANSYVAKSEVDSIVATSIENAVTSENPSQSQTALNKAISDAVAKAIADALKEGATNTTVVEQINNTITKYTYTPSGGSAISLTDVMENSHTHSNMSVLEGITQEKVNSWDNASAGGVTNVAYDGTNKKITKTVGGTTTDVVTISTLKTDFNLTKSDVSLDNVTNDAQVKRTEMGSANGVATLDSTGKVPSSQLPSYVDDVIEGYYYNSKFYKEAEHTTLITGESDKIYVDLSTDTTYRCSNVTNQTYTQIKGDLALGETETTAYRGDRGKIAYDHSQAAHAPANATVTSASTINGNIKIDDVETTVYTHPAFTAQTAAAKKVGMNDQGHVVLGDSLTATDVGLGNVGNFKAVSTEANQGLTNDEKTAARNNIGAGTSSLTIGTTSTTAAAGNHTHGNIGNDGTLTDTAADAAGNDYVVIRDASDNKIQTSTIKGTDVKDAVDKKHSHSNQSILDGITQEKVTAWDNASSGGVTNVAYDTTNKKITKTVGNATSDVVTVDTLKTDLNLSKSDVGLDNVGNFKAVSTEANQGLSTTEQENARANIGAGTSSFTGSYDDLTNKPTIPTVNDAKFSIKGDGTEVASTTANASTASSVDIVAGSNVTVTPDATNNKITIAATDTTYTFDGTYDASTNKAATVSTVTNAINALDGGTIGTGGNGKTITSLSQTNGNVSATFDNISITKSQVSDFPSLATVATSGSYDDLENKPSIPSAANDGTFSVKTKVGSNNAVTAADFTANQSSADDITFIQGSNVTLTTDTANRTITIDATDTTYESKSATSGGTDLSLVTTGEKYTWDNKSNLVIGTTTGTAFDGADGATAKSETDFLTGVNALTYDGTVLSGGIPADKRTLVLTVTSTQALQLETNFQGLSLGRELHIIVVASGAAATINIPHDGSTWFNTNDMDQNKQCQVASGKIGEINIINGGTAANTPKYYIRYVGA